MNFITRRICKKIGIQVGSTLFADTNYADDAALLIDGQQEYEVALNAIEEESSKLGWHIFWAKMKFKTLGTVNPIFPSPSVMKQSKQLQHSHTWAVFYLVAPTLLINANVVSGLYRQS